MSFNPLEEKKRTWAYPNRCMNFVQSHAIKTPTAIYCSGQIPCDVEGNLVEGTIQEKTAACIKNLKAVLTTAGSGIEKVVKVNIFLADMAHFAVRIPLHQDESQLY